MKKNVGSIDKIVRVIIAVSAGYFAYFVGFESSWISTVLFVVSGTALLTALIGTCPLYTVLGLKTDK